MPGLISVCESSAADAERACRSVHGNHGFAVGLERRAVVLVANAEIEREGARHFPIVFEEAVVLVLPPCALIVLARDVGRILSASRVECLSPIAQRPGEVTEQVLRSAEIVADARDRADVREGNAPRTGSRARNHKEPVIS